MVPYLLKSNQYWPRNSRKTKPNIKQYSPLWHRSDENSAENSGKRRYFWFLKTTLLSVFKNGFFRRCACAIALPFLAVGAHARSHFRFLPPMRMRENEEEYKLVAPLILLTKTQDYTDFSDTDNLPLGNKSKCVQF